MSFKNTKLAIVPSIFGIFQIWKHQWTTIFVLFHLIYISTYFGEEEKIGFFVYREFKKQKHNYKFFFRAFLTSEMNSLAHKMYNKFIFKLYIVLAFLINSGSLCTDLNRLCLELEEILKTKCILKSILLFFLWTHYSFKYDIQHKQILFPKNLSLCSFCTLEFFCF